MVLYIFAQLKLWNLQAVESKAASKGCKMCRKYTNFNGFNPQSKVHS